MTAVVGFFAVLARAIGLAGCVAIGLLFYYEGVPWIGGVPILGDIPIIGEIATGRVRTEARKAAEDATEGLVSKFELDEARALAAELKRQADRNAALAKTAEDARNKARVDADKAQKELEARIAADMDPDLSRWRAIDLDRWMHK